MGAVPPYPVPDTEVRASEPNLTSPNSPSKKRPLSQAARDPNTTTLTRSKSAKTSKDSAAPDRGSAVPEFVNELPEEGVVWATLTPTKPDTMDAVQLGRSRSKNGNHTYTFGKSTSCDGVFHLDSQWKRPELLSGRHFSISLLSYEVSRGGKAIIELKDLSTNGTCVGMEVERIGKGKTRVIELDRFSQQHYIIHVLEVTFILSLPDREKTASAYQTDVRATYLLTPPLQWFERDYEVAGEPIGSGTSAKVYRVLHKGSGEMRVAKRFTKESKRSLLKLYKQEINMLKNLNHASLNVIRFYDASEDDANLTLILEYAPCGDFFDYIDCPGPYLSESTCQIAFRQIFEGLHYLHAHNVAHRDMKPENILVMAREPLHLKITDFGLAKYAKEDPRSAKTRFFTRCGTVQYAAPEVIAVERDAPYGRSADMWSCGVMLYVALVGYPPFSEDFEGRGSLQRQILNRTHDFAKEYWSRISDQAIDLVKKLLQSDPSRRLKASQVLNHPWFTIDQEVEHLSQTFSGSWQEDYDRTVNAIVSAPSMESNASLELPDALSAKRYTKLERVGKGAYGSVYRGVDNVTHQVVAIKVLNLDTEHDDVADIQKEIALLSQLKHAESQNITRYHGSVLNGTRLWIVMDYAAGGSIRRLMQAGKLDERCIAVVAREVLSALSYLHKNNIIHRDIKAANILLTEAGNVQLCDFGVAGQTSVQQLKRNSFVGTPYWMAPEVIMEGSQYDCKADIWSLGITIYEIAKGNPPYAENDAMRAIFLIPRSDPPQLDGPFTSPMKEFVQLCLSKDPETRPYADDLMKARFIKNFAKTPTATLRELITRYEQYKKSSEYRQSLINGENSGSEDDDLPLQNFDQGDDGWEFDTIRSERRSVNAFPDEENAKPARKAKHDRDETIRPQSTSANTNPLVLNGMTYQRSYSDTHPLVRMFIDTKSAQSQNIPNAPNAPKTPSKTTTPTTFADDNVHFHDRFPLTSSMPSNLPHQPPVKAHSASELMAPKITSNVPEETANTLPSTQQSNRPTYTPLSPHQNVHHDDGIERARQRNLLPPLPAQTNRAHSPISPSARTTTHKPLTPSGISPPDLAGDRPPNGRFQAHHKDTDDVRHDDAEDSVRHIQHGRHATEQYVRHRDHENHDDISASGHTHGHHTTMSQVSFFPSHQQSTPVNHRKERSGSVAGHAEEGTLTHKPLTPSGSFHQDSSEDAHVHGRYEQSPLGKPTPIKQSADDSSSQNPASPTTAKYQRSPTMPILNFVLAGSPNEQAMAVPDTRPLNLSTINTTKAIEQECIQSLDEVMHWLECLDDGFKRVKLQ
ncbi:hypothetical protein BZG36_00063 [Bifiguratus adelaidae]|uniref:non-specific serine/threonine protein kinase n=1 Tax=Bifiguratus adelaidae TaxID=1938954 RepID=A0A261Y8F9_9FUNG|nr:hypothetical protein BZG36_00063 [Bifiguratus adelaidae]